MSTSSGGDPIRIGRHLAGRAARALAVAALVAVSLQAHDLNQSESRLDVHGSTLTALTTVDLLEFPGVDGDRNGRISIAEVDRSIVDVFAAVKAHLVIRNDGLLPERITLERHELTDEHALRMVIAYQFRTPPSAIVVTSTLDQISRPQHQHLVTAVVAGERRQAVLDASNRSVSMELSASRVTWPRVLAVAGAFALIAARFWWTRRASRTSQV